MVPTTSRSVAFSASAPVEDECAADSGRTGRECRPIVDELVEAAESVRRGAEPKNTEPEPKAAALRPGIEADVPTIALASDMLSDPSSCSTGVTDSSIAAFDVLCPLPVNSGEAARTIVVALDELAASESCGATCRPVRSAWLFAVPGSVRNVAALIASEAPEKAFAFAGTIVCAALMSAAAELVDEADRTSSGTAESCSEPVDVAVAVPGVIGLIVPKIRSAEDVLAAFAWIIGRTENVRLPPLEDTPPPLIGATVVRRAVPALSDTAARRS